MGKTNFDYLRDRGNPICQALCDVNVYSKCVNCNENAKCYECNVRNLKWLLEEHEEQVLTDSERAYLSAVLKPFRENIRAISKYPFCGISCKKEQYIIVRFYDRGWAFPNFKAGTMYKGMELYREYTLKELGL